MPSPIIGFRVVRSFLLRGRHMRASRRADISGIVATPTRLGFAGLRHLFYASKMLERKGLHRLDNAHRITTSIFHTLLQVLNAPPSKLSMTYVLAVQLMPCRQGR